MIVNYLYMKVILLKEVPRVGKPGDVLAVSSGYARNFLLPRKLAVIATDTELRHTEDRKNRFQKAVHHQEAILDASAQKMDGAHIRLQRKASPTNTLYRAVSALDIIRFLAAEYKVPLEENMVLLTDPIKTLGDYKIQLRIGKKEIVVSLTVEKE